MRWFLGAFLALAFTSTTMADTFVYVSMAPEKKIQIFRLDPADGKLTAVDAVPVEGMPGAMAVDPQKKYLFASLRSSNQLASFRIDPATGKLERLSTATLGKGADAAYVGTDRTGRWLLSTSYGAGTTFVHRIDDDGKIVSPAVETAVTEVTAHACPTSPNNQWVFVPHVKPNAVFQFKFDAATGKLTEAGKAMGGTDEAGPRHLAFHPTLNLAFTSDETGSSITAYKFDNAKGLDPVQTLSTLPAPVKGNSTAEVKVHPSGKFVWVSNRGHDSLAGFAIDGTGKLTALKRAPTEKTPRSFDIDPDGKYVFGAGEGSGKLAVFRVNLESGELTRLHTVDVGKSLPWVLVVKMGSK